MPRRFPFKDYKSLIGYGAVVIVCVFLGKDFVFTVLNTIDMVATGFIPAN